MAFILNVAKPLWSEAHRKAARVVSHRVTRARGGFSKEVSRGC